MATERVATSEAGLEPASDVGESNSYTEQSFQDVSVGVSFEDENGNRWVKVDNDNAELVQAMRLGPDVGQEGAHRPLDADLTVFTRSADAQQAMRDRQSDLARNLAAVHPALAGSDQHDNEVERVPERPRSRYAEIDTDEMLADAKRLRDADREAISLGRDGLLQEAEREEFRVRDLNIQGKELDQSNDMAERRGDPDQDERQEAVELEKNRRIHMMQRLHEEYRVSGNNFHFKDQAGNTGKIAFRANNDKLKTATNDPRVARSMAAAAYAKGWTTLRVKGHEDFKREVWFEAGMLGMSVEGYNPSKEEVRQLEAARERGMGNTLERLESALPASAGKERSDAPAPQARERSAGDRTQRSYIGILVDHGVAPFNHDKGEKQSYYVKLATHSGVQTIWGKDLERAVGSGGVKTGDTVHLKHRGNEPVTVDAWVRDEKGKVVGTKTIDAKRNAWEVKLTERAQVVEAVASALVNDKFRNTEDRKTVMSLMTARIAERDAAGTLPKARMYDAAAMPQRDTDRARPPVERNAERTR